MKKLRQNNWRYRENIEWRHAIGICFDEFIQVVVDSAFSKKSKLNLDTNSLFFVHLSKFCQKKPGHKYII